MQDPKRQSKAPIRLLVPTDLTAKEPEIGTLGTWWKMAPFLQASINCNETTFTWTVAVDEAFCILLSDLCLSSLEHLNYLSRHFLKHSPDVVS